MGFERGDHVKIKEWNRRGSSTIEMTIVFCLTFWILIIMTMLMADAFHRHGLHVIGVGALMGLEIVEPEQEKAVGTETKTETETVRRLQPASGKVDMKAVEFLPRSESHKGPGEITVKLDQYGTRSVLNRLRLEYDLIRRVLSDE